MAYSLNLGDALSSGGLSVQSGQNYNPYTGFQGIDEVYQQPTTQPSKTVNQLSTYQSSAPTGGSVLGVATSPTLPASPDPGVNQPDPNKLLMDMLDKQYGTTMDNLAQYNTQRLGSLDTQVADSTKNINDQYDYANSKFGGYRDQVAQNQARSVKDLAGNMRNILDAGNRYLGSMNGGRSSATDMYKYATSQEANKSKADLLRQANDAYNQINMKQADLQQAHQTELANLNSWKNQQISSIADWYTQAKQSAGAQRQDVQIQLAQQAVEALKALDAQAANYNQTLSQWVTDRASALNDYKVQLGQMSQYSAPQLAAQELNAGMNFSNQNSGYYAPIYANQKKKELNSLNTLAGGV